ncbi:MAG: DUF962 domain-containing protein [Chitinophagaceae bacterium]|nr:DUF962 domain-containing protein [Chitinophagaceae bacterium]
MKKFIQELGRFYPVYLRAHSDKSNQVLHFIGATLFFTLLALAFIIPQYWLIGIAIFTGYFLPGIGHRVFQHNDSFRASKPVLCVLCAFRMYMDTLTFQIAKKMEKAMQTEETHSNSSIS